MNRKIVLSAIVTIALTLASIQMLAVFAAGNSETPLGLEIAGKVDEVLSAHQTDIENFITEQQVIMAETQEERLGIIEDKKNDLKTAIEEANETRQLYLTWLEAGEDGEGTPYTEEDFAADMKSLATDISSAAQSMGELGELLGGLGQDLAGELKARAQTLSEEIDGAESEVAAEGTAIAEEMSQRNLPIPENIPNIPDAIPPTELPDEVPEVPPVP